MSLLRVMLILLMMGGSVLDAAAQSTIKVRFVQAHASIKVGEEIFLYAVPKALGYFREEGLDVELSGVAGEVTAGQILEAGHAEFADLLAEGVMRLRDEGATPIAFSSLKQNNGYSVGVLPGSAVRSLADLSNKTIGFAVAGSGTTKMLAETLRRLGTDPSFKEVSVGTGPQVATALRNKTVDAVVLWETVYGLLENQGLKLDHIPIPIQDELAGFSMATTERYAAENPRIVAGFCRAFTKGLYFTRLNPTAAVKIFFDEFPTVKPADKDASTAIAEAVNILDAWLSSATKGLAIDAKTGRLDPAKWDYSRDTYNKLGFLKGSAKGSTAITNAFFEKCNDFDRSLIATQAKVERR